MGFSLKNTYRYKKQTVLKFNSFFALKKCVYFLWFLHLCSLYCCICFLNFLQDSVFYDALKLNNIQLIYIKKTLFYFLLKHLNLTLEHIKFGKLFCFVSNDIFKFISTIYFGLLQYKFVPCLCIINNYQFSVYSIISIYNTWNSFSFKYFNYFFELYVVIEFLIRNVFLIWFIFLNVIAEVFVCCSIEVNLVKIFTKLITIN